MRSRSHNLYKLALELCRSGAALIHKMSVSDLEFDNNGSSVDRRVGDLLRETKDRVKSQICGLGAMGANSSSVVAIISDCQVDRGQTNHYVANSETYNLLHCDAAPA